MRAAVLLLLLFSKNKIGTTTKEQKPIIKYPTHTHQLPVLERYKIYSSVELSTALYGGVVAVREYR
jgi:hypothetical protein